MNRNRNVSVIALLISFSTFLQSCTNSNQTDSSTFQSLTVSQSVNTTTQSLLMTDVETTTASVMETTQELEKSHHNLYKRYLNNEIKSSIETIKDFGYKNEILEWPEDGFTVKELCSFFS